MTVSRETSFSPHYDAQPRQDGDFLSPNRDTEISFIRGINEIPSNDEFRSLAIARRSQERNPVKDRYRKSDEHEMYDQDGVRIFHRYVTMKNGTVYPVLSSRISSPVPEGLRGLYHAEGVGWTTRPGDPSGERGKDRSGLYGERQKLLGSLAVEATTIGIPQNPGYFISYDQYVDDVESILAQEAIEYERDPQGALISGISQSAMLLMGLVVRGEKVHGRKTLASHAAVPCLPEGISLKSPHKIPGELVETAVRIHHEVNAALRLGKAMSKEKTDMLIPTADLSWSALYTQPQMARSLFSGKSGRYARQLPDNTNVNVDLGDLDALSRARLWMSEKYLGNKPSVNINFNPTGTHVDVVNEASQNGWAGFQTAEITLLREHPEIRSNMATAAGNLLALTRQYYPQYAKPLPVYPAPQAA